MWLPARAIDMYDNGLNRTEATLVAVFRVHADRTRTSANYTWRFHGDSNEESRNGHSFSCIVHGYDRSILEQLCRYRLSRRYGLSRTRGLVAAQVLEDFRTASLLLRTLTRCIYLVKVFAMDVVRRSYDEVKVQLLWGLLQHV
jgi:hypothetical protein